MKQEPDTSNVIVEIANKKWPIRKKILIGTLTLLVTAGGIIFKSCLLPLLLHSKSNDNNQNIASSNSAPGIGIAYSSNVSANSGNFSQNVGPNNRAPVTGIANSSNVSANFYDHPTFIGATDKLVDIVRRDMEEAEKKYKALLNQTFPGGYYLFSSSDTNGNLVFPFKGGFATNIIVTNWSHCSVNYTSTDVTVAMPDMKIITGPDARMKFRNGITFNSVSFTMPNTVEVGTILDLPYIPFTPSREGVIIVLVRRDGDCLTFAFGLHRMEEEQLRRHSILP
jgi:hypothetical protein